MDSLKKEMYKDVGPGGLNCPCCGPPKRHRKRYKRMIKRRLRHKTRQNLRNYF